ncbi:MAG: substrate-binding domain-containing protein [Treponema sp.]|nr:substrate-binding domain-containing protein [Treponema sp.]
MKTSWKNFYISLIFLISLGNFVLIVFFVSRIYKYSNESENLSKVCSSHLLVGAEYENSYVVHEFYEGIKNVCEENNAVAELLVPEIETKKMTLSEWCEYAELVCADAIILLSEDDSFKVRSLCDVHGKFIPVIVAGTADLSGAQVCSIMTDISGQARAVAEEIKSNGWKNPIAIFRSNYRSKNPFNLVQETEKNLSVLVDRAFPIGIYRLFSDDIIYDEVRQILPDLVRDKKIDVILAYSASDINIIAQSIAELNLADKVSVIGFDQNEETEKFIDNGIVRTIADTDPFLMGKISAEEFFVWKKTGSAKPKCFVNAKISGGNKG